MLENNKILKVLSIIMATLVILAVACFAEPEGQGGWSDDPTQPPTAAPTSPPTTATPTTAAPKPNTTAAPRPNTTAAPRTTTAPNNNNNSNRSNDNSLRGLSVVGKTENGETVNIVLDPLFNPTVTTYHINVPYEVVRLEVTADANSDKANVTIPAGMLKIDIGSNNTTQVIVRAENGATKRYTINTVRSETPETTTEPESETETTTALVEEVDPAILFPEETTTEVAASVTANLKNSVYTKLGVIFGAGGLILLVFAVVLFKKRKKANGGND